RSHGFLERDLLLGPIWAGAQQAGFTKLDLSLVAPPLAGLGMRRYERVLRAGSVPLAFRRRLWHSAATTRLFFLAKGGAPVPAPDSRQADGLAATIAVEHRARAEPDGGLEVGVRVANTGGNRWLPSGRGRGSVHLGAHELDANRRMVDLDAARFDLPGDGLQPGESLRFTVTLPPLTPGHQFELDLVSDGITWFTKRGSKGCTVS
ncbi:MAG TPA: hypothetical protein VJM33_06785, partial [Microthrixaceae bacterium]|nr:hypothetical protein [Microthrixaceae bacterium]